MQDYYFLERLLKLPPTIIQDYIFWPAIERRVVSFH